MLGPRFTPGEIYEGSDIYLECQTRSNPAIHKLSWFHNVSEVQIFVFNARELNVSFQGKPLSNHRSNDRDIFISNQSLVIRQVNRHSSGNYTCVATNRVADTESQPFELSVKCKTKKQKFVIGVVRYKSFHQTPRCASTRNR